MLVDCFICSFIKIKSHVRLKELQAEYGLGAAKDFHSDMKYMHVKLTERYLIT
jgi:hypothetical protein